jgi:hypothetical protein
MVVGLRCHGWRWWWVCVIVAGDGGGFASSWLEMVAGLSQIECQYDIDHSGGVVT